MFGTIDEASEDLRRPLLDEEKMSTALCDTEAMISARLLTFFRGRSEEYNSACPFSFPDRKGFNRRPCSKRKQSCGYVRQGTRAYTAMEMPRTIAGTIPEMKSRRKWNAHEEGLRVNDVVLTAEDNAPHNRWRLATVVTKLLPRRDASKDCGGTSWSTDTKTPPSRSH
ncbi:hypothetical protein M514_08402, partial [Trichuris suis]